MPALTGKMCVDATKGFDQFSLPGSQKLPNSEKVLPLVILGDEAYPLQINIRRPFPRTSLTEEKLSLILISLSQP